MVDTKNPYSSGYYYPISSSLFWYGQAPGQVAIPSKVDYQNSQYALNPPIAQKYGVPTLQDWTNPYWLISPVGLASIALVVIGGLSVYYIAKKIIKK